MLSTWKAKIVAFFGVLASLILVYLVGRSRRNGDVNVAIARRELELANSKHEKLSGQLATLEKKQVDIVADILAEETARVAREAGNRELTDDQVIERLRTDGLLK